jgi:DNA-binding CsgD family transcriptional regulator
MYKLTGRQKAILRLLVAGRSQKEAAKELGISVKTLEYHMKRARGQWGCRTTVQLVAKVPEWRLK